MKQLINRYPVLTFFVLIIVWTWIFMAVFFALVPVDPETGPGFVHVGLVFLVASPSVFGILMTLVVDGREGLKELFSRAVRWRVNPMWYAAALLVVPATYGLSYVAQGLLGGPLAPIDVVEKLGIGIPIALIAALMEEFGWRGFALPRLQRRYSALVSALIVGLGWALWHVPINLVVWGQYGTMAIPIVIVGTLVPIGQTVVMAWIHNNTRESMLLMLVCHLSVTSGAILFGLSNPTAGDELRNGLVAAVIHWLVAIAIIVATGPKRLVKKGSRLGIERVG